MIAHELPDFDIWPISRRMVDKYVTPDAGGGLLHEHANRAPAAVRTRPRGWFAPIDIRVYRGKQDRPRELSATPRQRVTTADLLHRVCHPQEQRGASREVGQDPARVDLSVGGFLWPALRTGRATSPHPALHEPMRQTSGVACRCSVCWIPSTLASASASARCVGIHRRPPGIPRRSLQIRCPPSPCGRLSRPRTTTRAPSHLGLISRPR